MPIWLVVPFSAVAPPEEPPACPAAIDPPDCSTPSAAVSVSDVLAVIVPPVCVMLPTAGPGVLTTRIACSDTVGAVMAPPMLNGPLLISATALPSTTGPATVRAAPSVRLNPLVVVKPASVPTVFAWVSTALAADPVSVAALTLPLAPSVMAPAAVSVTDVPVTLLFSVRSPAGARVTAPPLTAPLTTRPRPSVSDSAPALANAPRFVTWLPAAPNTADPAAPVSVAAVMTPPGCVIAPLAARLTVDPVTLAPSASAPVMLSVTPPAPVSAPATARSCALLTASSPVVVTAPSVVILLGPVSDRLAAVAVSVPTVTAPVPVSVTAAALSSVSVPTPVRLNGPPMVMAPVVALPTCSVAAVMADVVPAGTKLDRLNAVPGVTGASATVPFVAVRLPPACNAMLLLASDSVGVAPPAWTAPVTFNALPSTRLKLPVLVKAPKLVTALPAAVRLAAPAAPVSVVAVMPPPGCVTAPVAARLTVGADTVPFKASAPATVSPICTVSASAPVWLSAWPSTRLNPPALL